MQIILRDVKKIRFSIKIELRKITAEIFKCLVHHLQEFLLCDFMCTTSFKGAKNSTKLK